MIPKQQNDPPQKSTIKSRPQKCEVLYREYRYVANQIGILNERDKKIIKIILEKHHII